MRRAAPPKAQTLALLPLLPKRAAILSSRRGELWVIGYCGRSSRDVALSPKTAPTVTNRRVRFGHSTDNDALSELRRIPALEKHACGAVELIRCWNDELKRVRVTRDNIEDRSDSDCIDH